MNWWKSNYEGAEIDDLMGKTLTKIEKVDNDEIFFYTEDGKKYHMYHSQDCCESVEIEEIIGDLDDLVGSPITMSEKVTQAGEEDSYGSSTWTFYKLATVKGYVTLRWLGQSNGYYSESVSFSRVAENEDE